MRVYKGIWGVLLLIGTAGDFQRVPPIEKLRAPSGNVLSEEQVQRMRCFCRIPYLLRWNLEFVDVAGTRVTDEGVRALRERFPIATIHT